MLFHNIKTLCGFGKENIEKKFDILIQYSGNLPDL